MAVRLMPESLTSKPLAEWCLCDFNEHLRTDAGTSEGWKLVRLAFDRVLGLNRFDCDVARTTNEQLAVQASGNAKSVCHFIRCRRIEPPILDNFVDAAEGLLKLPSPAGVSPTPSDDFASHATKTLRKQSGVKRRRKRQQTLRPLTAKQLEASKLHGECNGKIAEVAKRMGVSWKTASDHIKAAFTKLGKRVQVKAKTTAFKTDHRGQEDVAMSDEHRG